MLFYVLACRRTEAVWLLSANVFSISPDARASLSWPRRARRCLCRVFSARFATGSCVFLAAGPSLCCFMTQEQGKSDKSMEEIDNQIRETKDRMEALKAILYAKFGRSINLDTDD